MDGSVLNDAPSQSSRAPSIASRIASSDHHRRALRSPISLSSPLPLPAAASSAVVSQLLDMGFPSSWCTRAMQATNNDVDAALSWILAHGEELVSDDTLAVGQSSDTVTSSTFDSTVAPRSSDPPIEAPVNPLSTVSGSSQIKELDLTCTALNGGFPSVGCRGFPVSTGKWYFELKVIDISLVIRSYDYFYDNSCYGCLCFIAFWM